MSARARCQRCGSLTEPGRFCQICGTSLSAEAPRPEVATELAQLKTQVTDLRQQLESVSRERTRVVAERDQLQHDVDEARKDLEAEGRKREVAEREVERLKEALARAERMSKKTLEETTAEVYEYLRAHGGEIDPLECAGELHVSERDVMASLELLQRQRKIDRV